MYMFVKIVVYSDIQLHLTQNALVALKVAGARIADRMIKWHEFAFPMLVNFFFKSYKV